MNQLTHLLKHDFKLLLRNNIITISVVITGIYIGVFKGLTSFGELDNLLVLLIFNDPALLGFLFVGVIVLFEINENTIEALAVSPVSIRNYIWSKSIALSFISLLCSFAMAVAGHGFGFDYLQFIISTFVATLTFSFLGFVAVAGQKSFNTYLLRAIGTILLLSIPFIGYFELVDIDWFILFPSMPFIELLSMSFEPESTSRVIFMYLLAAGWCLLSHQWAFFRISKNFKS